jgi:hypothetical protein
MITGTAFVLCGFRSAFCCGSFAFYHAGCKGTGACNPFAFHSFSSIFPSELRLGQLYRDGHGPNRKIGIAWGASQGKLFQNRGYA